MIVIAGKTSVGKTSIIEASNIEGVIFLDKWVKDTLYISGHPVAQELVEAFDDGILSEDGSINTKELGKLVFSDTTKMNTLDTIVNRAIVEHLKALSKSGQNHILEIATYMKNEELFKPYFKKVILVTRHNVDNKDKFEYMGVKGDVKPIDDVVIDFDYIIENNSTIEVAVDKLKSILVEIASQ